MQGYIESITGIDFWDQLDDDYEEELESNVNLKDWNFNQSFQTSNSFRAVLLFLLRAFIVKVHLQDENGSK